MLRAAVTVRDHGGRLQALFMPACYPDRRERDEPDWRVVEVVTDIARGLGCSPAQVGLAWVMRQPAVATTIVGVTTVEQLKVNLAASEIGLDADALQVLDTTGRRPLGFPYRLSSDSSPTGAEPVAGDCLPPGSYR